MYLGEVELSRVRLPDGRVVDSVEVQVMGPDVQTVDFDLSDGSKLSIRITIMAIHRTKEYGETGEQMYAPNIRIDSKIYSIPDEFYGKSTSPTPRRKERSPEIA